MNLLPWIELIGDGGCTVLADNCRTLAYIERRAQPRPHPSWQASGCVDCCCPELADPAGYTYPADVDNNPAPWYDPARPASGEFFGLLLDRTSVRLEQAASARIAGTSSFDPPRFTPRQLTITGTIVSNTCRGTSYGLEWLTRTASGSGQCAAGRCVEQTARVATHCGTPTGDAAGYQPVTPPEWPTVGIDPCDPDDIAAAVPLPEWDIGDATTVPDRGVRDLLRVRFVSLDVLDDEPMDCCQGLRVGITFDVLSDGLHYPPDPDWGFAVEFRAPWDPACATPRDWSACDPDPVGDCSCGIPCRCRSAAPLLLPQTAASTCWCEPLSTVQFSWLTPLFPWSVEAVVSLGLFGGREGLSNVLVEILDAVPGLPHPDTVAGCNAYARRDPCAAFEIVEVPASSWLRLDGRAGRAILECPGRFPADARGLVTGRNATLPAWPSIVCGRRFWIRVTGDAYNLSVDTSGAADTMISAEFTPYERS